VGDVEALALHFLRRLNNDEESPLRLSSEVINVLNAYAFPGNVRELENAMTRAAALCSGGVITIDCLPPDIVAAAPTGASSLCMILFLHWQPTDQRSRSYNALPAAHTD